METLVILILLIVQSSTNVEVNYNALSNYIFSIIQNMNYLYYVAFSFNRANFINIFGTR